jgi:hypothetical protein
MTYYYYIIAFVFYFTFSYVLRRFVYKKKTDLKHNTISALLGLLFLVIYMTYFANHE